MRYFSSKEYGAQPKNWAIIQDQRGVLYVGNSDGVLEFDGQRWRLIRIANNSEVRSLALDAQGRIYVGAAGEIGYLEPDVQGHMSYVSLLSHLPVEARDFSYVWDIFVTPKGIVFSSFERLMRLQGKQFEFWTPSAAFRQAFQVGDRVFVQEAGRGLFELIGEELRLIAGGERFADLWISAMLPIRLPSPTNVPSAATDILIGTHTKGFFTLNTKGLDTWSTAIDELLIRDRLSTAIGLPDGRLALGTILGGVYFIDAQGRELGRLNKTHGLPSDTILVLYSDREHGLWIASENGLARAEISSPLSRFDDRSGLAGTIYAVHRHKSHLYVATSQGLFRLRPGTAARFERISGIDLQTRALISLDEQLLVANYLGVFTVAGNSVTLIKELDQAITLFNSKVQPGRVFIGTRSGLTALRWDQGRWLDEGQVSGIATEVHTIQEGSDGNLWLGTPKSGVFRVYFSDESENKALTPLSIERFGVSEGLPSPSFNMVYSIEDQTVFATEAGIYRYEQAKHRFEPDLRFASLFSSPRTVSSLVEDSQLGIWMFARDPSSRLEEAGLVHNNNNEDLYNWSIRGLQVIRGSAINATRRIHRDVDGMLWFGSGDVLVRYDGQFAKSYDWPFSALLRQVSVGDGRVIYGGNGLIPSQVLDYTDNALRFEFAAISFEGLHDMGFQVRLESNDSDWSDWSKENYKDYNNLSEGDYRFRIRAKNLYGSISGEASYEFTVLPPWYRTVWAYLVYIVVFSGLIWGAMRLRLQRLQEQKEALEATVTERTLQIVTLSDVGHAITAHLDLDAALETLYSQLNKILDASIFCMGLYHPARGEIEFRFVIEKGRRYQIYTRPMSDKSQLAVWCIEQRDSILIGDYPKEYSRYVTATDEVTYPLDDGINSKTLQSALYVPLLLKGHIIGVLFVQSFQKNAYNNNTRALLQTLSSYVATAIDNANAYRKVAEQKQKIEAQKLETADALDKVATLLNSTDEGFLSFKSDFLIESEVSKNCRKMLNVPSLNGLNIAELLFAKDAKSQATFRKGIHLLFDSSDPLQQEFVLGLLPKKVNYQDRTLELFFTKRADKVVMRLTDVTDKVALLSELEIEQHNNKKIIYAIVQQNDVLSIIDDFNQLDLQGFFMMNNPANELFDDRIQELYRQIHTFKGLFLQIYFNDLAEELHHLETVLSDFMTAPQPKDLAQLRGRFKIADVQAVFASEQASITATLGDEYFSQGRVFKLTEPELSYMLELLNGHLDLDAVQKVSALVSSKKNVLLSAWLKKHALAAQQQAQRLGKPLYPIDVGGDDLALSSDKYNAFLQSLNHVFRNAVVHGLETADEREDTDKSASGTISVRVKTQADCFEIQISDDGRGVDPEKIRACLISQHMISAEEAATLDRAALLNSLFSIGFSTSERASIDSGRGVGLAEVKQQLETLHGSFSVQSEVRRGTVFSFVVPH